MSTEHDTDGWVFRTLAVPFRNDEIEIRGDGRGHFHAHRVVREDERQPTTLSFELDFDQTELPEMIAQLDALRAAFPVRGAPGQETTRPRWADGSHDHRMYTRCT